MHKFSLSQVVTSFTHSSPTGTNSPVNLVFLSDPELLQDCKVHPPLASSDHRGFSMKPKPVKTRKVWLYQHGDYTKAH